MSVKTEGKTVRVTADQDRCCGSGMCALTAPELFDQRDEDGIVVVLQPTPPADLHAAAKEAESLCPSGAIRVLEQDADEGATEA
jgi:ferredoxin